MEKYLYIKKSQCGKFIEFNEPLNAEEYNNLGETWEDYLDNKWVMLSEEQIAFHEANADATVEEVFNMTHVPAPVRTLEQAKEEKIRQIEEFDNSNAVNKIIIKIGENTINTWFTPEKRADYKASIDAAELLGMETVSPVFSGQSIEIPTATAKTALAQIQIYANRCYNVTENHKAAVNALDTIEAVDSYDYTIGYPEKLTFNI